MPLYNNILAKGEHSKGQTTSACKTTSQNASMKLLQNHLLLSKRKQENSKLQHAQATQKSLSAKVIVEPRTSLDSNDSDEEYDPAFPNTYEVLQKEYLKAAEERRKRHKEKAPKGSMMSALRNLDYDSDENDRKCIGTIAGVAIAPPPSLTTSTNQLHDDSSKFEESVASKSSRPLDNGQTSIAVKIMSKMGYKAGQGLGKDKQGVSKPLEIEMNGPISGRIVVQNDHKQSQEVQSQGPSTKDYTDIIRESTRVVLLQNMVGPGEVDEELEAETKEECKKYGDVVKCLIYEIPNNKVADDESVRIFVEFFSIESAIKARTDLNGRYFGGRIVKASFYSQEKFNKFELAPESTNTS